MNEFVEECRREWRRLRVPDPVANEMAADLEADLREAEAEGVSPEEVLGSGAFDPRSFAASWAAERGVAPPPPRTEGPLPITRWRPVWRMRVLAVLVLSGLIAIIGASLALRRFGSAQAVASPWRIPVPRPVPATQVFPLEVHGPATFPFVIGLILLLVGIVGVTLSILYWSTWASPGHWSRRRPYRDQTPDGPSYY